MDRRTNQQPIEIIVISSAPHESDVMAEARRRLAEEVEPSLKALESIAREAPLERDRRAAARDLKKFQRKLGIQDPVPTTQPEPPSESQSVPKLSEESLARVRMVMREAGYDD